MSVVSIGCRGWTTSRPCASGSPRSPISAAPRACSAGSSACRCRRSGPQSRAESLATLGRIIHDRFTDPEIGRLLDRLAPLEESLPYDSDDASLIRVTRRDWEKARRVPTELRVEMTRAAASGHHAWVEARANDDFASFLPYLRAQRRAEAALHRVLRAGRRAVHGRCSTTTSRG